MNDFQINFRKLASKALSKRVFMLALSALIVGCSTVQQKPSDPFAATERADHAYQRGDWLAAEKSYEDIARQVPQDSYAWVRLGNIRLRQNDFAGAVHAYQAAVQRDPEQSRAHYNLATSYLLLARKALRNAQRQLPASDGGHTLINEKLKHFDALIYQPMIEISSPVDGLIQQTVAR